MTRVSRDPKFIEKLEDIVGLHLNSPEHALVLCCDEKSQIRFDDIYGREGKPGADLKS
jgi:hypothetical protein